jgi:steroid 5-alpha reductase family enzyme
MDSIKNSKSKSILVITVIYVLAAALGVAVYLALPFLFWIRLLIADVAATIFVFVFSVIFKNASVYDPYWSIQPIVIIAGYALTSNITPATLLLIISIVYWGIRLTGNWAYVFGGLNHQDWRYTKFEKETGRLYPFINFTGIHMVPTLIVYLTTLPAVFVIRQELRANIGSFIGMVVCVGAATLQLVADTQMQKYRKSGQHGLIRTGLWKYARHPNYLGEILMWWGIGLSVAVTAPRPFWLLSGALVNTLLFLFISIPMADERQSRKAGFAEYKAQTRMLLPIRHR